MMIYSEANEHYHLFKYVSQMRECQIESKIKWDKIVAIQLDTYDFIYFKDDGSLSIDPSHTSDRPIAWEVKLLQMSI